jgi:toxin CptA
MHSAPSVTYPVGRSRFAAALLLLIWLTAAVAIGLWWTGSRAPGWRLGAAVLLWLATGLWAAVLWWRSPAGLVAWDGETWSWTAGQSADDGALEVSLDLQRSILARWAGRRASHWCWLERASRAERWDDLRRAVYSRATPGAAPPAHAPPPKP